jgi:hypothetical protein
MFAEFINIYGMEILTAILGGIFTFFGFIVKNLVKKYLDDNTKLAIAAICVQFVEQVYQGLHGEEKLYKALERAAELLQEKGIDFSAVEMETLIEAAVAEFNEAFKRPAITE